MSGSATRFAQFHAFERDLLFAVYALERDDEPPKGLTVKSYLEAEYDDEIHHSRLYQNLNALVERDLLVKGQKDDRTNEYATTDAACQLVERHAQYRAKQVGIAVEGDGA